MADSYFFTFIVILLSLSLLPTSTRAQEMVTSPEELDLLVRDYTFKSFGSRRRIKTGEIYNVDIPANLSDGGVITANAARFRCGSLRRYGARFDGVRLQRGIKVQPCFLRVMVITQNLGLNWSSLYSSNYDLSGYQLVSPILGLTVYNYNPSSSYNPNSSYPLEVGIRSGQGSPLITISFSNTTNDHNNSSCAIFERSGTVSLTQPVSPRVCESTVDGHYGLVVKLPPMVPPAPAPVAGGGGGGGKGKGISTKRKMVVGFTVGAASLVAMLAVLVVIGMMVKKKRRIAEMERRGYEGEDLQFAVVGNVRTPVAGSTRTLPSLEHDFVPRNNPSSRD
ncbi:unnamed protein product [Linum tenue]|uniref:Uncharacterized protein n=2 Tax=Linum tenue TaxID=586396 RepID=A0AAV0Q062_9ROSI|nr:unnamed protein product [Linum tenue]